VSYLAQKRNTKRDAIALSIAALLHVLLIYGLINGLGTRMIDVIKGPLETKIIVDSKPPAPVPPPPPQVRLVTPPPPYIPPPLLQIAEPPPVANNAIVAVTQTAPPAPVAFTPAPAPVAVTPDTDVSEVPIGGATAQYPQQMMDDDRQGSAQVECIVGTDGKTSGCQLIGTKGGAAFGDSALQFAQTQTYRPAMHNGVAVEKRKIWNIVFSLN